MIPVGAILQGALAVAKSPIGKGIANVVGGLFKKRKRSTNPSMPARNKGVNSHNLSVSNAWKNGGIAGGLLKQNMPLAAGITSSVSVEIQKQRPGASWDTGSSSSNSGSTSGGNSGSSGDNGGGVSSSFNKDMKTIAFVLLGVLGLGFLFKR